MPTLEQRINALEQRNNRVEEDKAWEVSWFRRGTIAVLTYISALTFLTVIEDVDISVHALVPVGGYLLSTLTLPAVKKMWQN